MELKESLKICIIMWDYLADHPEKSKYYAICELKLPHDMASACALCEYHKSSDLGGDCWDHCPMVGLWEGSFCNDEKVGLYWLWRHACTDSDKSMYAKKIADATRGRMKDFIY